MDCKYCKNTGKIMAPKDTVAFEKAVDRIEAMGQFSLGVAEQMALKKNHIWVNCPHCRPQE